MAEKEQYRSLFLQCLRELLPSLKRHTDNQLEKKIGSKEKVEDCALEFFTYLESGTDTNLMQIERMALGQQALRCLSSYITKMGSPVTIKTVIDHLSLLNAAVNESFPGYHKAKLLRYTVVKMDKARQVSL